MHPSQIFGLFPPFRREPTIFVAMSFHARFDLRWKTVIEPAVRRIEVGGVRLTPVRVDIRKVSDSIMTEIVSGIGSSHLVFADITSIGELDGKSIRNGNVMYEIGLAHAVRLPEEVVIFRSDNDPLLFDVSGIRIHPYAPDKSPEEARELLVSTFIDCLREIDLRRHLTVRRTCEMLDQSTYMLLADAWAKGSVAHPVMKTMGQAVSGLRKTAAITRLLELGLLRSRVIEITPDMLKSENKDSEFQPIAYECTEFGSAVCQEIAEKLLPPHVRAELTKRREKDVPEA